MGKRGQGRAAKGQSPVELVVVVLLKAWPYQRHSLPCSVAEVAVFPPGWATPEAPPRG